MAKENIAASFEYKKDPGIDLAFHQNGASSAEIEDMYKRAFDTNDPSVLAFGLIGSHDADGIMFKGKLYSSTDGSGNGQLMDVAIALFPCAAGVDCNKPFFANKGFCIEDDTECVKTYESRILSGLNEAQIERARELANSIAEAYRGKNTKSFMRK